MTSLIPLVCGDPDKPEGAAFSRFVYPFAYEAKKQNRPSDEALCFVESDTNSNPFNTTQTHDAEFVGTAH
ncbi:hypothetical protein LJC22_01120 [Desulfosarcina sp. OttesenSCG-928-G10]|nr:hypothetical protein [Desulfosarcina sp. OttesenSCG-928-G10]